MIEEKNDNTDTLAVLDEENKTKNPIGIGHQYTQTTTNNAKKTCSLLQTTEGKYEPNIVSRQNRNGHHNTELRTQRQLLSTKQYTKSYRLSDDTHRNRDAHRCSGMVRNTCTTKNNNQCCFPLTIKIL